ncbi:TadE/TadG family type IV pilus assembly protein [Vibrio ishigakensis]|uniref:TadE/TadG family type IV pilus assembly protein n=1 Tax=Vibrio ishigakensis TaxID=1481914 RepID=UPI0021C40FF4|nr:TadE family protein [Vibrio ishigakensis]
MNRLRVSKQKGIVSVEFALGGFALFFALFVVFEIGRFSYIVNLTDATLSESTRKVRIFEGEKLETKYEERLIEVLESDNSFWNNLGFVSYKDFSYDIETYRTLELLSQKLPAEGCERCPLVMYQLTYNYRPVVFETILPSSTISRRILTVQEHEGWEDEES